MQFSPSTKWLLVGALMLAGALASVVFMFFWLQKEGEELKAAMQTIANQEALQSDQARLNALLIDTETERAQLNKYVLDGDDGAVALLSTIDEMASQLGIELVTSSLAIQEASGAFNNLALTVNVSGSEKRIRQALTLFETLPYDSDIVALDLQVIFDPETGSNKMNGTIGLQVSIK